MQPIRTRSAWLRRRALGAGGAILSALALVAALAGPTLAPYDPNQRQPGGLTETGAPLPPSPRFRLGTDSLGRDILSRLLYGARPSLEIGVGAALLALGIGLVIGL